MPTKLTETSVKNIAVPAKGSTSVWDSELTGFGLRVSDKGTKQFFLDYRLNGRSKRIAIGKLGDWTATEARARAKELRQMVDKGADPATEKRERRNAPTMQDLAERFLESKQDDGKDAKELKRETAMVKEIIALLGADKKVVDVNQADVQKMHREITNGYTPEGEKEAKKPRPVRANRIVALASVMFSMSLQPAAGDGKKVWRTVTDGNPCTGVKKNTETPAGRLYPSAEMVAIAVALDDYPNQMAADAVRLIALTGARPCEVQRATWAEFDSQPGIWKKPSSHTKQRRTHSVPLSEPALALIERLRANRTTADGRVFPAREGLIALQHCWRGVRERVGLPKEARLYDLRHTYARTAAGAGQALLMIGKQLGHSSAKTTERYTEYVEEAKLKAAVDQVANASPWASRP